MYGYNTNEIVGYLILALIVIIVVFLILREFICWYWKINRVVSLWEEQNQILKDLADKFKIQQTQNPIGLTISDTSPLRSGFHPQEKKCNRCGKTVDSGYTACPDCGGTELV